MINIMDNFKTNTNKDYGDIIIVKDENDNDVTFRRLCDIMLNKLAENMNNICVCNYDNIDNIRIPITEIMDYYKYIIDKCRNVGTTIFTNHNKLNESLSQQYIKDTNYNTDQVVSPQEPQQNLSDQGNNNNDVAIQIQQLSDQLQNVIQTLNNSIQVQTNINNQFNSNFAKLFNNNNQEAAINAARTNYQNAASIFKPVVNP